MPTKFSTILVAPDKFKASMTAREFCDIAEIVIIEIDKNINVIKCPLADGGEGSLDCFVSNTGAKIITNTYTDANFNKIKASFAVFRDTAFIECAQTIGLAKTKIKNPCITTSYSVGEQINDAIKLGAKKIYLALGGSATNDAGCGLACALGYKFLNNENKAFIPTGNSLIEIKKIIPPSKKCDAEIIALCDVNNVLFGESGSAYVYASQKGAKVNEVALLDKNLVYFNELAKSFGYDFSNIKGSGAAGGLGAGAMLFLNAKLVSGVSEIFKITNIYSKIKQADLVITGEGKIDNQSKFGKVVFELHNLSKDKNFVAFCGVNTLSNAPFKIVSINNKNESLQESIKHTKTNFKNKLKEYLLSIL